MSYIGTEPAAGFTTLTRQSITGNGGTGYTLDNAVANENEIEVFVNNVRQEPGTAYTVSGTTLTMTGNVVSTDDFYVVYQGKAIQTSVPGDNTVTTAMLQDTAVTAGKLASTLDLSSKTLTIPQNSIEPIYVSVGVTGLQTLTTDTDTLINFDDQIHSSGLTWDTTNKKCVFDATTAGRYMITVGIAFFSSGNNMEAAFIKPHKNGASFRNTIVMQNGQTPAALGSLRHLYGQGHYVHNFASGDEFNLYARLDVTSGSAFVHERQYGSELHLVRLGD